MPNRLARSTSPYLRQHADNPVDWYEWGQEAFAAAVARDVPVLLSIGYSACHWCHVMAHESFEDPDVAAVMNDRYVNIKVDREERPDVDAVYMAAVQTLTGRGGWPMTVWLHPDGRPFYAGTYFPPQPHPAMPSFRQVMDAVTDAWTNRRVQLDEQAERLTEVVSQAIPPGPEVPGPDELASAYRQLEGMHDAVHGGFGGAPKFPQQPALEFLLRIAGRPWAPRAASMVRQTLEKMAAGGIHDHVGGGFARYSVDEEWLVPHFEKMLYDNAQLARLYLRAGQVFDSPWFSEVAVRTLRYIDRDLGHPGGGFQSAEDADSDGREGAFYVWDEDEFRRVTAEHAPYAAARFGVTGTGNFEGATILHHARLVEEAAAEAGIRPEEAAAVEEEILRRLFEARATRTRPSLDHKIVTAWNGLAIRAFAEAGAVLGRPDLVERAARAADFVFDALTVDGRLMRSWSEGSASVPGFLDDHGAMAVACFSLYEATGQVDWFRRAEALTRRIPELFSAPDGGFHLAGADVEVPLVRQKDLMDNPSPAGNSLAADALVRLAAYTGEDTLLRLAEGAMRAASLVIERSASAAGHLLGVVDFDSSGAKEVAIVGPDPSELAAVVWDRYRPNMVLAVDRDGTGADTIPLLEGRWQEGRTLAYVCEDFACLAPVDDASRLRQELDAPAAGAPGGPGGGA